MISDSLPWIRAFFASLCLACAAAACVPASSWRKNFIDGDRAYHHGRYAEAEESLRTARQEASHFLPEDPRRFQTLAVLADLYASRGQFEKSEKLMLKLQLMADKDFGPRSLEAAMNLTYLGDLYDAQGRIGDAERCYHQALQITEAAKWSHSVHTGPLAELASLYQAQGKLSDAETLYQQAVAAAEKTLGPDNPLVAERMDDLALLYYSQGKDKKAEKLYLSALAILERNQGALPARYVGALNSLALFYEAQGRNAEGETAYRKALDVSVKRLRKGDPNALLAMSGLADLLRKTGRARAARRLEGSLQSAFSRIKK
ncbi:MAG: tetratricopeptide repeat protein [Elusimicrobia bacterium]|nr:tetratricopeptide repeat protein [Elusimicrobiota bacterium]